MKNLTLELTDVSRLVETEDNLENTLQALSTATARKLRAKRCSILLISEHQVNGKPEESLQVFAHYGNLPRSADKNTIQLEQGVAGTVAATGQSLVIADIGKSPFRDVARYPDKENPSFLSAPILVSDRVIGVINVSLPEEKVCFSELDLEILELFARQAAQSVQILHLQGMLKSRFVAMAVTQELEAILAGDLYHGETDLFEIAVHPHPPKLAKIVAKAFFKELTRAGFGARQVIEIATEVLNLLQNTLDKHKHRLEGRD
jgi:L-methionine (R)-S-oxide reductase